MQIQTWQMIQRLAREGEHERALGMLLSYLEREDADLHWGLGLLESMLGREEKDEPDARMVAALREQRAALRERILALDSDQVWLHRWEEARQLNERAWAVYERAMADGVPAGQRRRRLESALVDAEASQTFWPYFLCHRDTQVRILLALGRREEAYAIVRWCLALQPDWPDFDDLKTDSDYRLWLERQVKGGVPFDLPRGEAREDGHLDEWHRARDAALDAMVRDGALGLAEILALEPQEVDLSQGRFRGEVLPARSLALLRHWMLYGFSNHPGMQAGKRMQGDARLFFNYDLTPMDVEDAKASAEAA